MRFAKAAEQNYSTEISRISKLIKRDRAQSMNYMF
jgi:hypothetical protein